MVQKRSQKKVTTGPDLKILPPSTQAFKENVNRAHFQATIWKSALSTNPSKVDITKYGWSRDDASKTLKPVTSPSDIHLAPLSVLILIKCG